MLGLRFFVYNGIRFFSIEVTTEKLGHLLGEFSPKKKKPIAKKKKEIDGTKNTSTWFAFRL